MKSLKFLVVACAALAVTCLTSLALAESVAVGDSKLISKLDYSDTFTQDGVNRVDGQPIAGDGLLVEETYGNPPATWTDVLGTSMTHTSAGVPDSGAGSDTGIVVNTTAITDYGFEYGLNLDRDVFIVQYDSIIPSDRVDIDISRDRPTPGYLWGASTRDGCLAVMFRPDDITAGVPGIALGRWNYASGSQKVATGLSVGYTTANIGEWRNYAVKFDLANRELKFWVDEVYRGSVDIDTVGGGIFNGMTIWNDYVGVGYANGSVHEFDNVQVGIPEPGTLVLLGSGLLLLVWRRHK